MKRIHYIAPILLFLTLASLVLASASCVFNPNVNTCQSLIQAMGVISLLFIASSINYILREYDSNHKMIRKIFMIGLSLVGIFYALELFGNAFLG